MNTTAARLTMIEAALAKLTASRGPRISELLRQARRRVLDGAAPEPILYDVAELEGAARGRGVAAELARARLRLLRDPAQEGLQTAKDERGGVEGTRTAGDSPDRVYGPPGRPYACVRDGRPH